MAHKHRWVSGSRVFTAGFATLLTGATASTANAAHYKVYTSTIAADLIKASDNYCSLAEAVKSINDGSAVANCTDTEPSNPGMITLIEASGKSYANYHYKIGGTTLTFNRSVRIQPSEEGFRAFVDSSGALAFKVSQGVEVTIYGVDISHTGTGTGRLIWNAGTLSLAETIIRNGNVKTAPAGIGGGIYNEKTGTLSLYSAQVLNNSAKKGGGIYNDDGIISYLSATISGNSATMAGGGLYNRFTGVNPNAVVNLSTATIKSNSAKAGGGIANVGGEIAVFGTTSITSNFTVSGTGSGETCHLGTCGPNNPQECRSGPCDGNGGGVLNLDTSTDVAGFRINEFAPTTVSSNTATQFGGAFYNTGQLNMSNITMASNKAKSGAAIFAAALVINGTPQSNYCDVMDGYGPSKFTSNTATGTPASTVYSIVDSSGAFGTYCGFKASGSGNSSPRCNPVGVRSGAFCPQ